MCGYCGIKWIGIGNVKMNLEGYIEAVEPIDAVFDTNYVFIRDDPTKYLKEPQKTFDNAESGGII